MTQDEIIRMAQEVGIPYYWLTGEVVNLEQLKRFAALVADAEAEKHKWDIHSCGPTCERYACVARRKAVEAEREACAKVCEQAGIEGYGTLAAAAMIRARGEK